MATKVGTDIAGAGRDISRLGLWDDDRDRVGRGDSRKGRVQPAVFEAECHHHA
ncbi:hypothetical protein [Nisaea sp.]|uniref:hypothetical protein n=1 Tax=Nisaea sp. TaxID=2024842 RepID=UPI0032982231